MLFKRLSDQLVQSAADARAAGDKIFAPTISFPAGGGNIGALLAAIEARGWKLEHWSVATPGGGQPCAYAVFRRT